MKRVRVLLLALLSGPLLAHADATALQQRYESQAGNVLNFFDAYTNTHPRDAWGWHYRGLAALEAGHYPLAAEAYARAIQLQPTQGAHLLHMALLQNRIGSRDRAKGYFSRAAAQISNRRFQEKIAQAQRRLSQDRAQLHGAALRQLAVGCGLLIAIGLLVAGVFRNGGRRRSAD